MFTHDASIPIGRLPVLSIFVISVHQERLVVLTSSSTQSSPDRQRSMHTVWQKNQMRQYMPHRPTVPPAESQKRPHVPFRDSKLTRLLQQSLGGNSRTALILALRQER